MATIIIQPWLLLLSSLLFCSASASASASPSPHHHHHHQRHLLQSAPSPQNIETFFPSIPSPAFGGPTPSPRRPPPQTPLCQSTSSSDDTGKITTAVLATAACTFALSFLVFYIFYWFSFKKDRRHPKVFNSQIGGGGGGGFSLHAAEAARKGMVVDENGIDVLYWRNLVGGGTPERCNYCNCVLDQSLDPSTNGMISIEKHDGRDQGQQQPLLPPNSISSSSYTAKASNMSSSSSKTPIAPPASPAPPPPPPPKAPPPPPPPPMAKKSPAPPPPMPPRPPIKNSLALPHGGGGSSRPPVAPAAPDGGRGRARLKPLHWDKVTPPNAEHSMVWDKINNGSFRIDDELMDTLFGYSAGNQSNPNSNRTTPSNPFTSPATTSSSSPAQICLLDPRKSQNIAIVLRSMGIGRKDIIDSLGEGRGLGHDALEKLSRIALSKDEETMILQFSGDPTKLADAESFLYRLIKAVDAPFARIDAMLFKSSYDAEILHIKKSIQTLELACRELKSHGLLLKLLEAILKAGNRMNAGTARGNAKAFNLTALCKLSDVKSTDGKTTLLHFVAEEVVRSEGKRLVINRNHSLRRSGSTSSNHSGNLQTNSGTIRTTREEKEKEYIKLGLPVVGGVSEELANVKKAAGIDYDALVASCSSLGARMSEIRRFLHGRSGGDSFVREMKGFLEASEEEIKLVVEEKVRVMEVVRRTTEYYQPGASNDKNTQPLQLFVIVRDFFVMFDRVCIDIARNMQKKPVPASGVTSPATKAEAEKRPVARFPNLPPRFLSENSKSSSDSDSDDGF